jgi:glucosamine kinase
MAAELFIGVDGGGSGCRARIRDAAGHALGEGTAGPANACGRAAAAFDEVLAACLQAALCAGLGPNGLARLHAGLGLAGAAQARDRDAVLALPHPFASLAVDDDAYAACLGAHDGGEGAVLIVGTGSCGLALVDHRRTTVSGRGLEVSDDGSGAALGREGVRRALWALDGLAPRSPLSDALLAAVGGTGEAAVAWAKQATPADYGSLAPLIFAQAEQLDALGVALVEETARHVARMIGRLFELGAPAVCLIGGLAGPLEPWLAPPVRSRLSRPAGDAMDGAILMARNERRRRRA